MESYEMIIPQVTDVVRCVTRYAECVQRESTRRCEIQARRDAAVEAIKNNRKILTRYMECRFGERRRLYEGYFHVIDVAINSGDGDTVRLALEGILAVYGSPASDGIGGIMSHREKMMEAIGYDGEACPEWSEREYMEM